MFSSGVSCWFWVVVCLLFELGCPRPVFAAVAVAISLRVLCVSLSACVFTELHVGWTLFVKELVRAIDHSRLPQNRVVFVVVAERS